MKAQLLKINIQNENSLCVRNDTKPLFNNKWHYHPEIEIIHIRKGQGTHVIGDHLDNFEENDLYIVGSNLPHLWRYEKANTEEPSDAIVIHFKEDFWSNSILKMPEMYNINQLLSKSKRGLRIRCQDNSYGVLMEDILNSSGLKRVMLFIELLSQLNDEPGNENLASIGFIQVYDDQDAMRLNRIYNYVFNNFQNKITIEEISEVSYLSVNSFCRYFKSKTNKTFFTFLLEVRIGHARKLLLNNDLSISQVCLESGFNNLSNFNRYFKEFSGKTPSQYMHETLAA